MNDKNTADAKKLKHIVTHNKIMQKNIDKRSKARMMGMLLSGLMAMYLSHSGIENPTNTDLAEAQSHALETAGNTKYSPDGVDSNEWQRQVDDFHRELESQANQYAFRDPSILDDFEKANNAVTPQQQAEESSQNQLDEMFFTYMNGLYKDYQLSDFNSMTKEDFDYTVNQFEDFLNRFAFKLNKKEFNQAMSLAFTLSASDHYNQSSNQIRQSRQRLESVVSTLKSIDRLSGGLPEPEKYAEGVTQEDVEKQMSEMINSQIDDLRKMRDDLENKCNDPDNEAFYDDSNEEKLRMYDDMIKRIIKRFRARFGFDMMEQA